MKLSNSSASVLPDVFLIVFRKLKLIDLGFCPELNFKKWNSRRQFAKPAIRSNSLFQENVLCA